MTGSFPDLFDVKGANTLLYARCPGVGRWDHTGQIRDEGNHSRNGEHQRRIIAHQRCRGHHRVAAVSEVGEPTALNVCGFHESLF